MGHDYIVHADENVISQCLCTNKTWLQCWPHSKFRQPISYRCRQKAVVSSTPELASGRNVFRTSKPRAGWFLAPRWQAIMVARVQQRKVRTRGPGNKCLPTRRGTA